MGFWARFFGTEGITANSNLPTSVGAPDWTPGDPDGLELIGFDEPSENRSLPIPLMSPWSGWPVDWSTPNWTGQAGISRLVDVAWACLDLNANVLSAMPVYRTKDGRIINPVTWMSNPDPEIYTSWQEFAKQLFWDYQMGEAFVLPWSTGSDGYPSRFRVIPPWLMNVELKGGRRIYQFGTNDVTGEILHIRYWSTTTDARGHGALEAAGARMTAIGLLQKYANNLAETGGIPLYWLGIDRRITESEGRDVMDRWIENRAKYAGHPALVSGGAKLNQANSMNARDMALMELSQFNESRIAILLGVPPFLVGLAGAAGSLTYSNIADLFDFHDRSSLRPKARMVMEALSAWTLPRGQASELNRDDYTRLPLDKRYAAYKVGIDGGFLFPEDVRTMERLDSDISAQALTGGTD